ncbi:MAG TPA: LytTR family DNA-binding domain-containing protein [Myxococcus sp.]|nr:LytTR family DNA-binding domain-containing protein [Myxococcus sp.]
MRIHRSAVVNSRRIRELRSEGRGDLVVVLTSGAELRVARSHPTLQRQALPPSAVSPEPWMPRVSGRAALPSDAPSGAVWPLVQYAPGGALLSVEGTTQHMRSDT